MHITNTPLDLLVIAQWARTTWRVVTSLRTNAPDRPAMEGRSYLVGDTTPLAALGASVDACWYEGTRKHLQITDHGDHTYHVTWRQVTAWIYTWTETDRLHLADLHRQYQAIDGRRPDEDPGFNATIAEHHAANARYDARMDAGDRDRAQALHRQMRQLIDNHLISQLSLF